jgi:hypothetical protein
MQALANIPEVCEAILRGNFESRVLPHQAFQAAGICPVSMEHVDWEEFQVRF